MRHTPRKLLNLSPFEIFLGQRMACIFSGFSHVVQQHQWHYMMVRRHLAKSLQPRWEGPFQVWWHLQRPNQKPTWIQASHCKKGTISSLPRHHPWIWAKSKWRFNSSWPGVELQAEGLWVIIISTNPPPRDCPLAGSTKCCIAKWEIRYSCPAGYSHGLRN